MSLRLILRLLCDRSGTETIHIRWSRSTEMWSVSTATGESSGPHVVRLLERLMKDAGQVT